MLGGLVGAAVGQWLGWRAAGPLPGDERAAAIARLALNLPLPAPERLEPVFSSDGTGEYGPGRVRYTVPAEGDAAVLKQRSEDVRVRLHTAGWRIDRTRSPGLVFVADKGDWRIRYSIDRDGRVHFDLVRAQPLWVLPAGTLGVLLGVLLGGSLARAAWRYGARLAGFRRRVTATLAVLGCLALLPALGVGAVQQIGGYARLSRPQIPLWTALTPAGVLPAALLGTGLLAAAVVAAWWPRVRAPLGVSDLDQRPGVAAAEQRG